MEAAFFELSKYILAILLAFYTFECFAVFRYKNPDDKNGIYFRQNIIMFFIHFIGFMAICFKTGDMFYLFFFGFQQIVLLGTIASFRTIYPTINKLTVNNMCMLLTISFIVLSRISKDKALKQFKIVLISLIISLFIPILIKKIKFLKRKYHIPCMVLHFNHRNLLKLFLFFLLQAHYVKKIIGRGLYYLQSSQPSMYLY